MSDLFVKKANLEARYAELNQRLQAIQQDYARGLDADSEERAQELQNADVLAEIKRVTALLQTGNSRGVGHNRHRT